MKRCEVQSLVSASMKRSAVTIYLVWAKVYEVKPWWPHKLGGTSRCCSGLLLLPDCTVKILIHLSEKYTTVHNIHWYPSRRLCLAFTGLLTKITVACEHWKPVVFLTLELMLCSLDRYRTYDVPFSNENCSAQYQLYLIIQEYLKVPAWKRTQHFPLTQYLKTTRWCKKLLRMWHHD